MKRSIQVLEYTPIDYRYEDRESVGESGDVGAIR
jgi:hypothetical protein